MSVGWWRLWGKLSRQDESCVVEMIKCRNNDAKRFNQGACVVFNLKRMKVEV